MPRLAKSQSIVLQSWQMYNHERRFAPSKEEILFLSDNASCTVEQVKNYFNNDKQRERRRNEEARSCPSADARGPLHELIAVAKELLLIDYQI